MEENPKEKTGFSKLFRAKNGLIRFGWAWLALLAFGWGILVLGNILFGRLLRAMLQNCSELTDYLSWTIMMGLGILQTLALCAAMLFGQHRLARRFKAADMVWGEWKPGLFWSFGTFALILNAMLALFAAGALKRSSLGIAPDAMLFAAEAIDYVCSCVRRTYLFAVCLYGVARLRMDEGRTLAAMLCLIVAEAVLSILRSGISNGFAPMHTAILLGNFNVVCMRFLFILLYIRYGMIASLCTQTALGMACTLIGNGWPISSVVWRVEPAIRNAAALTAVPVAPVWLTGNGNAVSSVWMTTVLLVTILILIFEILPSVRATFRKGIQKICDGRMGQEWAPGWRRRRGG